MVWRRISLLLVGIAGGVLTAVILCVSVIEGWNRQASTCFFDKSFYPDIGEGEQISASTEDTVCYPSMIQGTSLVLERLSVYEGPFLEDGTDREVTDVAALMVRNVGYDEILNCGIALCFGEICYTFYGERIPAGTTVLLIENGGAQYRSDPFTSCVGWQINANKKQNVAELVMVEERAMGTIIVTNTSDKILHEIQVFYKNWLSPPDILVGGVAYSVVLPRLLPGQSETLYPYHFAYGYSKVVSITVD